jgi:protein gp37
MSDNTAIEWSDASWNPVLGCARVSPGCDHCYAIIQARIRAGNPNPKVAAAFDGLTVQTPGRADWTGRVNLLPERLEQPLHWRKPRKVFVNSLADLFYEDVPDQFIAEVFAVMAMARWHTFQLLTKRHGRMRSLLTSPEFRAMYEARWDQLAADLGRGGRAWADYIDTHFGQQAPWPIPNLCLGVSAEDQHWAAIRVHALLSCQPAAGVLWVSAEPLLGAIDLRNLQIRGNVFVDALYGDVKTAAGEIYAACPGSVSWVVAGGESGPGARPMLPEWARSLRDQCQDARIPFLFKQAGAALAREWGCADRKGGNAAEWPEPFPREFPRAA